jgi:hypothetical protein
VLNSITSTGVSWCDGGVSPVVDGVGPKMMRALVNLSRKHICDLCRELLCVACPIPQIR